MNIVFLFNSDHPSVGCVYGDKILSSIFNSRVLNHVTEPMKVSIGDVLTFSAAQGENNHFLYSLCESLYIPTNYDQLFEDKLEDTYLKATVFAVSFQNMTPSVANQLHSYLEKEMQSYLGAMDIDVTDIHQFRFFKSSLIEVMKLESGNCYLYYSMSTDEREYFYEPERIEKYGLNVFEQDTGARNTIFDNYDTYEHFRRIEEFKGVFSSFPNVSEGLTESLIISLEELHPKLFETFASAAKVISRVETEDDIAQAALSGRRLLEKLANYLFPPSDDLYNGKKVGKAQYKNRIWAYIETTIIKESIATPNLLLVLGKEVDRLIELFNSGLHSDMELHVIIKGFKDLIIWLDKIIKLSPNSLSKPYLAYESELDSFLFKALQ